MKPIISNPVSSNDNMWVSKMPNNFLAIKRIPQTASGSKVTFNKDKVHQQQAKNDQQQKWTKYKLMKHYAEQIHPQYQFLTKAKIKAALVLADNNLHECRLILDLKTKLIELKKPLNLPLVPECLKIDKPNQVVLINTEKSTNVGGAVSSNESTVYDFSDTETFIESSQDWFAEKRSSKLPLPSKKVGVFIVKCVDGYKAIPL